MTPVGVRDIYDAWLMGFGEGFVTVEVTDVFLWWCLWCFFGDLCGFFFGVSFGGVLRFLFFFLVGGLVILLERLLGTLSL